MRDLWSGCLSTAYWRAVSEKRLLNQINDQSFVKGPHRAMKDFAFTDEWLGRAGGASCPGPLQSTQLRSTSSLHSQDSSLVATRSLALGSFWGYQLKVGEKYKVRKRSGYVLQLTGACLHNPCQGKNFIQVIDGDKGRFALARLEKGKMEHASFNLSFRQASFVNKGESEVHLIGHFEPDALGKLGEES